MLKHEPFDGIFWNYNNNLIFVWINFTEKINSSRINCKQFIFAKRKQFKLKILVLLLHCYILD